MASMAEGATIQDWLRQHQSMARIELEVTLCHVLECSRAHLLCNPEQVLSTKQLDQLHCWTHRLQNDVPLAYLCGEQEFWGLTLRVDERVLVPRPDTETLVEQALKCVELCRSSADPAQNFKVLDLGTGSGAIALALARELPNAEVHASDISSSSLEVARANGDVLGLSVNFHHSDWFGEINDRFDLIASNPPYIAPGDPHLLALTAEPELALVAADSGLAALRAISESAAKYLNTGGWLLLEHGFDQGDAVRNLLQTNGFSSIASTKDLGGNERVTCGQKSPEAAEAAHE